MTGTLSLDDVPARLLFDLFYCLVLDETRERVDRRQELDSQLASAGAGVTGRKPDRATWGKTPAQQRAMRNAMTAGGAQANVGRTRGRVAGPRGRG